MYTILLNASGTLTTSRIETIMQKSTGNSVKFIVPANYMGHDLSALTCYMKYVMPVSKNMRMKTLTFSPTTEYGSDYLECVLDANANFTAQAGDIEVSLSFFGTTLNGQNDSITTEVAKTQSGRIHITPISVFEEYVPDELLNEVDQRIIALQAQAKGLNALADSLYNSSVRDIGLDDASIKAINGDGSFVGTGVPIRNISSIVKDDLVGKETDSVEDGVSDLDATDLG